MKKYLLYFIVLSLYCIALLPQQGYAANRPIGACQLGTRCVEGFDQFECEQREGGVWLGTDFCEELPSASSCTIPNGVGKFVPNYEYRWEAYSEAIPSDLRGMPVCNPVPTHQSTCTASSQTCKTSANSRFYFDCMRIATGTQSCVVNYCNSGYVQSGNTCVAASQAGVCSSTSQSCITGNYVDLADSATQYKWQCSGINGGQNASCSLNIPSTPVAGKCSASHYGCALGTSQNTVNGTSSWTWQCKGTNGGATTNCSETKNTTVIPPTVVGNWPTNGMSSSAFDDTKTSNMNNSTKYLLEWCSPHKIEINGGNNSECITKKFTNKSGTASFPINGGSEDLGLVINNMPFEFVAEGVITLKTFAMDNAHNITKKNFVFKIDKTAPQFGDFVFTEKSGNQYINVENHIGNPTGLGINHISTIDDGKTFPNMSTYSNTKATASEIPFSQTDVKKIRYKQTDVGISPIINVTLSGSSDTYGDIAHFNYVSHPEKVEFYKGNIVLPTGNDYYEKITFDLRQSLDAQKQIDLKTHDFTKSNTAPMGPDSGSYINVRLTDNAGNYSEKAFYVFRDESVPDMSKFVLKFMDNDDLRLTNGDSKIILANQSTAIKYDWGEVNDHMAPSIVLKTEKHDNPDFPTQYQSAVLNNSKNGDTSSAPFNFEKVDNDLNSSNYRNYSAQFETPGIIGNKICDVVGNCINGDNFLKSFQVMASVIDKNISNIAINLPSKAIANNPANPLVDKYKLTYKLNDAFGNAIRNVVMGGNQIKTVSTKLNFYNGLTGSLVSSGTLTNTDAVRLYGNEFSGDINLNSVVLKETNSNSDGEFNFELSSRTPTVGGYPYLKQTARLELAGVTNIVQNSNTSNIHNPVNQNESIIFTGTPVVAINSIIEEKKSNRYNVVANSLVNYGKITAPLTYLDSLAASVNSKFNFEFAAPFIYHAKDFNILRDGIDSQHSKFIVNNGSGIGQYKILEKYFDVVNINNNSRVDFIVGNTIQNNFKELVGNAITNTFFVKYAAKAGQNFDKWGYISYIGYDAGGSGYTYIPSISRGVASTVIGEEKKGSAYFPNVTASEGVDFLTQDIAITGLVNKIDGLVNINAQSGLASLDLERPYTRAQLLEKIKKKIFTVNKIGNWCRGTSTDLSEVTGNHQSCTFDINGEIITFYQGDTVIDCGTTCNVNDTRAIIVKDGRVTIKSNINTFSGNGQLFVASITDKGLENVKISNGADHDLNQGKQKGWMSIDESVTNIDAFLLSQGPLVSSSSTLGDDLVINYSNIDRLLNQLHIYGSVFSLNTISGDKTGECPYIEQDCGQGDTTKIYDLSFLRRFTLVDSGNFNGIDGVKVPFSVNLDYTNSATITTKSSGGYRYSANGTKIEPNTGLRQAKPEHLKSPVIIERDHRWTTNPSYFAKD